MHLSSHLENNSALPSNGEQSHLPETESAHVRHGRLAKGAKTPAGIAHSSRNAVKHGLSGGAFCLLKSEDPDLFAQQKVEIFAALTPRDAIEVNFCTRILESTWLLQRCQLLSTRAFSDEIEAQRQENAETHPDLTETDLAMHAAETLHKRTRMPEVYERYRIAQERTLLRFHNALIKHRATLGKADGNAAPRLPLALADSSSTMFLNRTIGPAESVRPPESVKTENCETTPPKSNPCNTAPSAASTPLKYLLLLAILIATLASAQAAYRASCDKNDKTSKMSNGKSTSRRDFLKRSTKGAATTAAIATGSEQIAHAESVPKPLKTAHTTQTTSICPYCAVGCSVVVHTLGDQARNVKPAIVHIEGDPESPINRGTLCPKGASLEEFVQSDRRLTKVLYKAPGAKDWQPLSWSEAIPKMARRIKESRDKAFIEKDDQGRTVNRLQNIAMIGGCTDTNEINYLLSKFRFSLGLLAYENQSRL